MWYKKMFTILYIGNKDELLPSERHNVTTYNNNTQHPNNDKLAIFPSYLFSKCFSTYSVMSCNSLNGKR